MSRLVKISLMLIIVTIFSASCDSTKKNQCGCPGRKGFIGY